MKIHERRCGNCKFFHKLREKIEAMKGAQNERPHSV